MNQLTERQKQRSRLIGYFGIAAFVAVIADDNGLGLPGIFLSICLCGLVCVVMEIITRRLEKGVQVTDAQTDTCGEGSRSRSSRNVTEKRLHCRVPALYHVL